MRIHHLAALALVPLALAACASKPQTKLTEQPVVAPPAPNLIGRWEGTDAQAEKGAFSFRKDGTALIETGGQKLGDPAAGETMRWELDHTVTPMTLDWVFVDAQGKETRRLRAILELPDPTHMRLRTFFSDQRPPSFEGGTAEDTIQLERTTAE